MIETEESRLEFEKRRARAIAAFKKTPITVLETAAQPTHLDVIAQPGCKVSVEVVQPKKRKSCATKKDAAWWREYRKKPKKCPHCGKDIKK